MEISLNVFVGCMKNYVAIISDISLNMVLIETNGSKLYWIGKSGWVKISPYFPPLLFRYANSLLTFIFIVFFITHLKK